jgi:hypothetical protein
MNAYFRWVVLKDQPSRFAIELRLVQADELGGSADIPQEAVSDVTLHRLQHFKVTAGETCVWKIEQAGHVMHSGQTIADNQHLVTIPRVRVTATPITLYVKGAQSR